MNLAKEKEKKSTTVVALLVFPAVEFEYIRQTAVKVSFLESDSCFTIDVIAMYKLVQHNMCTMTPVNNIHHNADRTKKRKTNHILIIDY